MTEEILVGVDGSAAGRQAVRWAAAEATRRGWSVVVIAGVDANTFGPWTGSAMVRAELRQAMQPAVDEAVKLVRAAAPAVPVRGRVVLGGAARVLVTMSSAHPMLVVGRTGKGAVASAVFGSVSRAVTASAHCPVVTVAGQDNDPSTVRRVLLGVAADQQDDAALAFAAAEADRWGVPLVAVHGWHVPSLPYPRAYHESPVPSVEIALVSSRIAGWLADRLGPTRAEAVRVCVRSGPPAEVVQGLLRPGDVVVIGRHHRTPLHPARVGAVATELSRSMAAPLVVVPAEPLLVTEAADADRSANADRTVSEDRATTPSASGILSY